MMLLFSMALPEKPCFFISLSLLVSMPSSILPAHVFLRAVCLSFSDDHE